MLHDSTNFDQNYTSLEGDPPKKYTEASDLVTHEIQRKKKTAHNDQDTLFSPVQANISQMTHTMF